MSAKDPFERAKLVLAHADRMGCKRYLTAKDIVEGSPNLNLAFVAHIFQHRWEWTLLPEKYIAFIVTSFAESINPYRASKFMLYEPKSTALYGLCACVFVIFIFLEGSLNAGFG